MRSKELQIKTTDFVTRTFRTKDIWQKKTNYLQILVVRINICEQSIH